MYLTVGSYGILLLAVIHLVGGVEEEVECGSNIDAMSIGTVKNLVFPAVAKEDSCTIHFVTCEECYFLLELDPEQSNCIQKTPIFPPISCLDFSVTCISYLLTHEPGYPDITYHQMYPGSDGTHNYSSISSSLVVLSCVQTGSLKLKLTIKRKLQIFSDIKGHVTSPGFPEGYAHNDDKYTYVIQNEDPAYLSVRLWFSDFYLSGDSAFKIEAGDNNQTLYQWQAAHGLLSTRPAHMMTKLKPVTISFATGLNSDPYALSVGFKAFYEFSTEDTWNEKPSSIGCITRFSSYRPYGGEVRLEFGASSCYGLPLDCVWVVHPQPLAGHNTLILHLSDARDVSLDIRDGPTSEDPVLANLGSTIRVSGPVYIHVFIICPNTFRATFATLTTAGIDYLHNAWTCPDGFRMCYHDNCAHVSVFCDGLSQCDAGWDERLPECDESGEVLECPRNYECHSPEPSWYCEHEVCDGIAHCPDLTDERQCSSTLFEATIATPSSDDSLSWENIVYIAVGILVLVGVCCYLIFCYFRRLRKRHPQERLSPVQAPTTTEPESLRQDTPHYVPILRDVRPHTIDQTTSDQTTSNQTTSDEATEPPSYEEATRVVYSTEQDRLRMGLGENNGGTQLYKDEALPDYTDPCIPSAPPLHH